MMRMEHSTHKDTKINSNASTKVTSVVHKVLLPLLQAPVGTCISFQVKDINDINQEYFENLGERDPDAIRNRESFIQKMAEIYDSNIKK